MGDQLRPHAADALQVPRRRLLAPGPVVLVEHELLVLGRPLDRAEQPGQLLGDVRVEQRRLDPGAAGDQP